MRVETLAGVSPCTGDSCRLLVKLSYMNRVDGNFLLVRAGLRVQESWICNELNIN